MRSSQDAYSYLTEVRKLVRYLDICDGNMEEGSLRCDANVSVRLIGQEEFGTKVEVKNMNSIRNVQRAIEFEIIRQIEVLERLTYLRHPHQYYAHTYIQQGFQVLARLIQHRFQQKL